MSAAELMPSIAILTPVRDEAAITPAHSYAVTNNSPSAIVMRVVGAPVDEARNALVRNFKALARKPEFVVHADDDSYFLKGTIERLISSLLDRPDIGLLTGWCGNRSVHGTNIIRIVDERQAIEQAPPGLFSPSAIVVERMTRPDVPFGGPPLLAECDFIASHFMIHRASLFDALEVDPFTPTTNRPGPEDFEWCGRVREAGFKIAADINLPIWHCGSLLVDGVRESVAFLPGCQPCKISTDGIPRPIVGKVMQKVDDRRAYGPAVARKLDAMGRELIWRTPESPALASAALTPKPIGTRP